MVVDRLFPVSEYIHFLNSLTTHLEWSSCFRVKMLKVDDIIICQVHTKREFTTIQNGHHQWTTAIQTRRNAMTIYFDV